MRLTLKPVTAPVAEDTVWYLKVDVNAWTSSNVRSDESLLGAKRGNERLTPIYDGVKN